jgi:opacity protein-like surface antigen
MGHIRSGLLAAAVGIAVLAPQAASANVITETYTMTQVPAVSADGLSLFPDSPVAEFNPADGTLTSVAESLKGTATWTSNSIDANLFALLFPGTPAETQFFFTPGTITFAISGSPTDLNDFKGTGSVGVALRLTTSDTGDTFATSASGLMGTITYTYTPAASPAVPEPSTWAMMALGFAGLGFLGYRKTRSVLA